MHVSILSKTILKVLRSLRPRLGLKMLFGETLHDLLDKLVGVRSYFLAELQRLICRDIEDF